jgi:hypothetical protein
MHLNKYKTKIALNLIAEGKTHQFIASSYTNEIDIEKGKPVSGLGRDVRYMLL